MSDTNQQREMGRIIERRVVYSCGRSESTMKSVPGQGVNKQHSGICVDSTVRRV